MKSTFPKIRLCLLFLYLSVHLMACYSNEDLAYYADRSNYILSEGIVQHIMYSDDMTELYLGFSDISPEFDDTNFRIVGDSLAAVQSNGIDVKLQIGDTVFFSAAPKYLGDGYAIPIVSLTVREESLLTFDDGFSNLQKWLAN